MRNIAVSRRMAHSRVVLQRPNLPDLVISLLIHLSMYRLDWECRTKAPDQTRSFVLDKTEERLLFRNSVCTILFKLYVFTIQNLELLYQNPYVKRLLIMPGAVTRAFSVDCEWWEAYARLSARPAIHHIQYINARRMKRARGYPLYCIF